MSGNVKHELVADRGYQEIYDHNQPAMRTHDNTADRKCQEMYEITQLPMKTYDD